MTSKRLFYVLIGVMIILAGAAIGGTLAGERFFRQKTATLLDLKAESMALQARQASLVKAKKDIERYEPLERIAKTIVPQEKDQARTVRELVAIGNRTQQTFSSISFPSSTLGQAPAKKATPSASADSSSGSAGSTPPAPAPSPAPSAAAKPSSQTQVEPVPGISGVSQMQITIQSAGPVPYNSFIRFLTELERNRRTAQVSNLTIQPDSSNRNLVTINLTLNVYLKQ